MSDDSQGERREVVDKPTAGEAEGQTVAPTEAGTALVQQAKNLDFASFMGMLTGVRGFTAAEVMGGWSREKMEELERLRRELKEMTADRDGYRDKFHATDKENAVIRQQLAGASIARWIEGLGLCVLGAGLEGVVLHQAAVGIAFIAIGAVFAAAGEIAARRSGGG